jgi:hypothetical protein
MPRINLEFLGYHLIITFQSTEIFTHTHHTPYHHHHHHTLPNFTQEALHFEYVYMFRIILSTNTDIFPKQHFFFDQFNEGAMRVLRGKILIFKNYLHEG